ncbi:hypothetical protein F4861DRAFT_534033 [Xylaria intraflava]|nr:hypothetical protein F4861DRAFT_534033 [Xylaria intraflava]
MCRYRKSVFLCNHTQLSAEPLSLCLAQQKYLSGLVSEPCSVVNTHGCSTIRLSKDCEPCTIKYASLDKTLSALKEKIAELRQHLDDAYGCCMKHVDEAGLKPEAKPDTKPEAKPDAKPDAKPGGKEEAQENPKTEGDGEEEVDPVARFLKMKMNEKYSHLMMLGNAGKLS